MEYSKFRRIFDASVRARTDSNSVLTVEELWDAFFAEAQLIADKTYPLAPILHVGLADLEDWRRQVVESQGKVLEKISVIGDPCGFQSLSALAQAASAVPGSTPRSPGVVRCPHCGAERVTYEVHRGLKVTQKTAWFMFHRIRLAMQDAGFNKLGGEVEVDETFIGGKVLNMHKGKRAERIHGRGSDGKEIVFGMMERGGKVIAGLQALIRESIQVGAAIFSDELKSY